jgi:hypothetical protein
MSMNRMRMIPIAVLALGTAAVHAAPAHAARIPVPRLDTGRVVVLTIPDRATAALPTHSASVSSLRSAFDDARPQMRTRLDEIAEAAAEQSALRTRLKTCLEGVRGAAVEHWLEGRAAGAAPDFNELVYSGAVSCFSSQFPEAVGGRNEQFAQAAAGQANDAAYEEVSVQGEPTGTYGGGAYVGGSSDGGGDDGGISIALIAGGLALLGCIGIVAFFATGRRI